MIYWREPLALFFVLVPIFILLWLKLQQRYILKKTVDDALLPWVLDVEDKTSSVFVSVSHGLLFASWVLFCIALAGPRTPQFIPPSLKINATPVMVISDFSLSMNSRDGNISRKQQMQKLLKKWGRDSLTNIDIGLMVYSGYSHHLLKFTSDINLFSHYVADLNKLQLPTLGNNLSSAIDKTMSDLEKYDVQSFIVILTDGDLGLEENKRVLRSLSAIEKLSEVQVIFIAVGSVEPVSVLNEDGTQFIFSGKKIVSRKDFSWLMPNLKSKQISLLQLKNIEGARLKDLLNLPQLIINEEQQQDILWDEWFYLPLVLGMFFLLLGLSLDKGRLKNIQTASFIIILFAVLFSPTESYAKEKYTFSIVFNEGVTCYQKKDFLCASEHFSNAAWMAENEKLRGMAVFNLANSFFFLGDYEQASVLFSDANHWGVELEKITINKKFAESLAASVRKEIKDKQKTLEHAALHFAMRDSIDNDSDRVSEGLYFSMIGKNKSALIEFTPYQMSLLISKGVTAFNEKKVGTRSFWKKSKQNNVAEDTIGLLNRLIPMEVGLPAKPRKPYRLKGQQPW